MIILEEIDKDNSKLAPFPLPAPTATLKYWYKAKTEFRYSAYIIKAEETLTGNDLVFRFVHTQTGAVSTKGPHKIDLRDATAVWRDHPSTLLGIQKGQCALLFLRGDGLKIPCRPEYVAEYAAIVTAEATETGGGTGKWPKTAAEGGHFIRLAAKLLEMAAREQGRASRLTSAEIEALVAETAVDSEEE